MFYLNNIYIKITPVCFDTFVSSSGSSDQISTTIQYSPPQHTGDINIG